MCFEVESGKVLAILAEEEGGKTSLLKALAGLIPCESGSVFLGEKSILNLKPRERNFSLILENEGIFRFKTVKKQLELPLKIRKIPRGERALAVQDISEKFNITHLLQDIGAQLYEDDKVRLAFARAFIRKADCLLLDNPFNNLKANERDRVFHEMLPHIKKAECPVIFATNLLNEAVFTADYIICLNYGIIIQKGTPNEILNNPSEYVRETFFQRTMHSAQRTVTDS